MIFELITYAGFQFTLYLARLSRKENRLIRIKECYKAIPCIAFMMTFCMLSIIQTFNNLKLLFFWHQVPICAFFTIYSVCISDAFVYLFDDIYVIIFNPGGLYAKYDKDD